MPSGSLLDMDGMVRNVVGMGNLEETRRRNDIYEKNSLLQAEQNQLDQQKIKQQTAFRAFDELGKMADHPALATNHDKQAEILLMQLGVMETGLGVKFKEKPTKNEIKGGYDEMKRLARVTMHGTPEEKRDIQGALGEAIVSNPKWGRAFLDDLKKTGELSTYMQELDLKLQTHQAQLEAINVKTGRLKMQEGLFTEHAAGLTQSASLAGDPQFSQHLREVMSYEKPESRQAYLNLPENQAFKQAFEAQIGKGKNRLGFPSKEAQAKFPDLLPKTLDDLQQEVMARSDALADAQAKSADGTAPQEQAEELKGYNAVWKARQVEAEWLKDPYNKDKWKALKKAEQDLKILQGSTTKKQADLVSERDSLRREQFDQKTQTTLAELDLQEEYLKGIQAGKGDSQALGDAIGTIKKQYPGTPFDATKITNPDKKGKLNVGVSLGKEDLSRQFKAIEAAQGVLDYVGDLRERIQANPAIVGMGAQMGTAFAGAGQQLRAIVGMDPGASKFLNTKPRDEAEALHELLVYLQAKTMDPTGALDIKVVQHARDVVGDLSSFTTGPQQVLNKLDTASRAAERSMRKARRIISLGPKAYLNDETPNRPAGELSELDILKELQKELTQ